MFLLQSRGVLALNPWLGSMVRIIQSWSNNMKIVHDCAAVRSRNAMGWLLSFQDAWLCRDCCARYGIYIYRYWFAAPSLPRSLRCCVPRRLRGRSFWQMQRQTGRPLADLWSCGVPKIGGTINNYWIILDTTGRYCFHHPQQLSYCSGWLGGCKVLTQKTSALQKFWA